MQRQIEILNRKNLEWNELPIRQKEKETKSVAIQVDMEQADKEEEQRKQEEIREIKEIVDQGADFEGLSKIIDKNWPEEILLRKRKEGLAEGQVEYIRNNMETISSKGGRGERSNTLFVLPYKADDNGINDIPAMYDLLIKFKAEMPIQNSKAVKILTTGNHKKRVHKEMLKSESKPRTTRTKGPQTDKIIIKSEGKTYAELLISVKTNVDIAEVGLTIKSLKKTEKCDLLLEVAGGKDKVKTLKDTIIAKTKDTEVFVKSNDATLHITDIDADINEEELKKEIVKSGAGVSEEQLSVISLRPNRSGNQTATVKMRKDIAAELVKRGKIKIGWVLCRLRRRVNIIRCYKCLNFGHRTSECTGPDKSDLSHDIAYAEACEKNVDLIIISEPNVHLTRDRDYLSDNRNDVTVQLRNKNIGITRVVKGEGFVKLTFDNWHLYCCYISSNIPLQAFKEYIDSIMVQIRDDGVEAIFAGDLNAKSSLWGSPFTDVRGDYVTEWAAELDLVIINTDTTPTYERSRSCACVTGTTANISRKVKGWKVLSGEALTFHHHIIFEIDHQKNVGKVQQNIQTLLIITDLRKQLEGNLVLEGYKTWKTQ
ncbi:hypothetical protein NQ314_018663 [Rhamnusium bicolor]|uniref:Endonuclease/exonuclease/phosphatase domain-containing protein n=1 Tax=Rhamnusium bicolor TaxID=1586634 RepID=A0AAV8WQH4_9CUCU|nr:hypothetical protein NQ314_018663 [Rhamnusium bicolor]